MSLIHINLDQYICFHTIKEKYVPDCHLAPIHSTQYLVRSRQAAAGGIAWRLLACIGFFKPISKYWPWSLVNNHAANFAIAL